MGRKLSTQDEALAIADLIDRFVNGDVGPYEWDDFCSYRGLTPAMEALRVEIATVEGEYPPTHSREWCSEAGIQRLREIAERIRVDAGS